MKSAKISILLVSLGITGALAFSYVAVEPHEGEAGNRLERELMVADKAEGNGAAVSSAGSLSTLGYLDAEDREILGWYEDGLRQFYTAYDFQDVVIAEEIRDPVTGVWERTEYTGGSTFPIHDIKSSGKDYLYVGGTASATGDLVIEEWRLKASNFQMPGSSVAKTIKRKEIYRGPCETLVDFHADPERRFLLVMARDQTGKQFLYRLPAVANSSPVLVLDGSSIADLNSSDFIHRYQHVGLGRIWVFENLDSGQIPGRTIVLTDTNNDGIFDPSPIIDGSFSLYSLGILDPDQYVDTFNGND